MDAIFTALFHFLEWAFSRSAEQVGNFIYLLTLVGGVSCVARGHRTGKIDLWHMVTSTDRCGVVRTDTRKLFEVVGMSALTITFYFLTVTRALSEWYVLIFAVAVIGGRIARDIAQIKEAALGTARPSTTTTTTTATVTEEPK